MRPPLVLDLFSGLWGWTAGFLANGWQSIGVDLTIPPSIPEGARFCQFDVSLLTKKIIHSLNPDLIVASPPCTEYSYMAMPWSRGKQIAKALRGKGEFPDGYTGSRTIPELTALFDSCFRIQCEACEAAGRHIPMIVENVRGACPWVGRSAWNYGSFHLWGDVPALMPITFRGHKVPGFRFDGSGGSFQTASVERAEGYKCGGAWFGSGNDCSLMRQHSSHSKNRKAASAEIAKIPFTLASHIAKCALQMIGAQ